MNIINLTMMEKFFSILSIYWFILPIILISFYIRRLIGTKTTFRRARRGVDRSQTYPRQFPCGWYRICDSDEISKRGQVKHAFALNREMVIFRSDDEQSQIYVLDAFCIHMGANLAFGGRVMPGTNCIQCPFHLWQFNGETGHCTKVPYADGKLPEKVKLKLFYF
jgi:nitrite reductase/ring-hydroxylating ferredoxin subunit